MARDEQNREDLWAEARALLVRGEIGWSRAARPPVSFAAAGVPAEPDETKLVCGFRAGGAASFYFGHDRVYHFNAAGALRRGFLQGRLLKAEQGTLVRLERQRTATESLLVRYAMSPAESRQVLAEARALLAWLEDALRRGAAEIGRAVPDGLSLRRRLEGWLAQLPECLPVAQRPGLK